MRLLVLFFCLLFFLPGAGYGQVKPKAFKPITEHSRIPDDDTQVADLVHQHYLDSLKIKDLSFRLARVKFYIDLVNKRPANAKYLKGWITRAVK